MSTFIDRYTCQGARQVGKTHLIRRVLKEEGCDVFEVNLIETPEAVSILQQAGTVDELMIGCLP